MRLFLSLLLFSLLLGCQSGPTEAVIETSMGDITVLLYDDTPIHKDNFLKLIDEKFYDGTLFHRVIPNFMIQGGDPTSKGANAGAFLGGGGPGYLLDAEIGAPHISGALAAARTGGPGNPEKKSSGSQFYLVTGQPQSGPTLDQIERMKGIKYSEAQRAAYEELGGRPDLDQDYTVFGNVVDGMDVVNAIAQTATGRQNRPTTDVVINTIRLK